MPNEELERFAAIEDRLADEVANLHAPLENRAVLLTEAGVFGRYEAVLEGYLEHAGPPMESIEALKRALFLSWYSQAEPSVFSGIPELAREVYSRVADLLAAHGTDDELDWMIYWYNQIADWGLPQPESEIITSVLHRSEVLVWPPPTSTEQMEGRGAMGRYWGQAVLPN